MRAKQVYEFIQKKSLRNNIDTGINYKIKSDIEKWFNKWLNGINYKINDNFEIEVFDDIFILRNGDVGHFPFCNKLTVHGNLDIISSNLLSLPKSINIKNTFNVYGNRNLIDFPEIFYIGSTINIERTGINKLPDNMRSVNGSLIIDYTNIEYLPENLSLISGNFSLKYTQITKLPDNLTIKGNLNINYTDIKKLPRGLNIEQKLILNNYISPYHDIPKDLKVNDIIDEIDD